ncbi:glycosyltransferase family 2 protein [Vibrio coralliirubri]|uniref:glycosyltransferase family 2 protein n=1 Tax=Vibrio coralliirubri TaxID=1516159 RepID=UPI00063275FD|nr:glycosyltransferase family 2 protein [Vibrio coralliirubri]CDT25181.1 Beta 1-4 glucosyltransferase LgtF (UDP-glucose--Lipooligosaccharide beta 1-4 glucosyltransferase) [Vibrio coralliirubri]CDT63271.1 Beta 1-4 glucosyltransferase LgtF (UDP-glucose--Lipooligosaccharide beta 1-4 glucosyltransferase) [Vibrio coralliirubri]CDT64898.1 Beta 1-4 glucosyltransferase LgtF (UDP-glucose--Lipooligosaccharide beta 1-4 glucosyltransferase) [Vibrio coralliirubri]CDT91005.1 Beta 1-4 glucosyltransferase LgtF
MTSSAKPTLAVALIVKNEAKNLDACLKTVADWVDEIVILDSGSTDETEQVARQYTEKFYVNKDWPGFGPQRQLAQEYVESDFILWLDADERITDELKVSIQQAVAKNEPNTLYNICRLSWVFGRYIRHCGWYPDRVVRLYPTQLTQYDDSLVHEKVEISSDMSVKELSGDAIHYTYNDLHHYLVKSAGYAQAWAEQRERRGKKSSILEGMLHAIACFLKMYVFKAGFLDGKQGFLLSVLSAHSTLVKYADLWIKTSTEKPKD